MHDYIYFFEKEASIVKINEIIVVEGKSDTNKIRQAVQADTIETNGSALSKETLALIKHAQEKRGVIIFTDPDFPGNEIRQTIEREIPGCKHAFLPKKEALAKSESKSVGIEHASVAAIRHALAHVQSSTEEINVDIVQKDLIAHGLIGTSDAKRLREELGTELHIGYTNGKQLLQRLRMFQISKEELNQAMMRILEGGKQHGE